MGEDADTVDLENQQNNGAGLRINVHVVRRKQSEWTYCIEDDPNGFIYQSKIFGEINFSPTDYFGLRLAQQFLKAYSTLTEVEETNKSCFNVDVCHVKRMAIGLTYRVNNWVVDEKEFDTKSKIILPCWVARAAIIHELDENTIIAKLTFRRLVLT